jgi:predicted transcriptional regulator
MKDEILDLFFDKKMKQKDIAELLNIAKSTVSKVVSKDSRFITEKSLRKANNKVKRNKDIQRRVEQNRKKVQFKNNSDDLILKQMHSQASMELSKRSHLSNENYRKWNKTAYNYNPSKKRFEFDENLGRSYDVPKYIKAKIF